MLSDLLQQNLTRFLTHFTYIGLVLFLCATGMGLPCPEDIPLITSGYLCHPKALHLSVDTDGDGIPDAPSARDIAETRRHPNVSLMIIAGMIGVLGGDSIVFFIGRRGLAGSNPIARHLRKVLHSRRRAKVERHFHRHGNLTIIVGRFLPGARSLVFAMAGMSQISYWRFLLLDGLAALVSVTAFVLAGFYFAERITWLLLKINHIKEVLTPIALLCLAGALALYLLHRRLRPVAETVPVREPPVHSS